MNRALFAIGAMLTLPLCAGVISPVSTPSYTTSRLIFYGAAQRAMRLPDGSDLLIYEPERNDRPPGKRVFIVSPSGPDGDRSFSLEMLIPGEIASGYPGQIRSVAMSSDHKWLAAVGGWFGAKDKRGHNGLFVLRLDEKNGGFWRLKSWFEVADLAIGEVAFGPDDLLVVTSRPHSPGSGAAPILTLFSYSGERVGSFIISPSHGEASSSALEMRIVRTADRSYVIYDPETEQLRYIDLTTDGAKPALVQTRSVKLPFRTERINLVVFDPRPDGRVVLGRSTAENLKGRTFITVIDQRGTTLEEWESPRWWHYGFADEKHLLHGFSPLPNQPVMEIRTVAVR